MQRKIILIDYGHFLHTAVYSRNALIKRKKQLEDEGNYEKAKKMFIVPSTYTAMSMLIGALKRVGVNSDLDDRVIIACDSPHNWRKKYEKAYKGNRPEMRKQAIFINWNKEYNAHNELLDKINNNTSFFVVRTPTCEADDIIAEATKYYKDYQCVIIGTDHDYDQLLQRDNVRIFCPHSKAKKIPYRILDLNRDKEKKKAYKSLMKKVNKEVSDNLITEISNEKEYNTRLMLVNLMNLPDFVTKKVRAELDKIDGVEKENFNLNVFSPSIRKRLLDIYKEDKIITYEKCYAKLQKRKGLKNK